MPRNTQEAFKAALDLWVLREVDKVIDIEAEVERFVSGDRAIRWELRDVRGVEVIGGRRDALVETWVVQAGLDAQVHEDGVHKVVPVTRAATKTVKGLLRQPEGVLLRVWVP